MKDRLIQLIERETGILTNLGTPIESLDIDSLEFICLIQSIREELGPIELKKAVDAHTIGELMLSIGAS